MNATTVQPAIQLKNVVVHEVNFLVNPAISSSPDEIQADLRYTANHNIGIPEDSGLSFIVMFEVRVSSEALGAVNLFVRAYAEFTSATPVDKVFADSSLVRRNAPAIAFPFIRSYIHTITIHSGMPGILLPTMSFTGNQSPPNSAGSEPSPSPGAADSKQ
jgi:preprotein translocase subunit SecB